MSDKNVGTVSPQLKQRFEEMVRVFAEMERKAQSLSARMWDSIYTELHLDPDGLYSYNRETGAVTMKAQTASTDPMENVRQLRETDAHAVVARLLSGAFNMDLEDLLDPKKRTN